MTPRAYQIAACMTGRQASAVNDSALREAVRGRLIELATAAGRPLEAGRIGGIVLSVIGAAAKTLIFEQEVVVALEMGSAGELEGVATTFTQTNCARWVSAYAVCGDRLAAQQSISLQAARDRKRADEVGRDDQRADYDANGLSRAWEQYTSGGWTFRAGFGAALYAKIGREAMRSLLGSEAVAAARRDALRELRQDANLAAKKGTAMAHYASMSDDEVCASDLFTLYYKSGLVRAYFGVLSSNGLDVNYKPAAS